MDFDLLSRRSFAPGATMDDKNALWGGVFALTEWLFIARGSLPDVRPYIASNPTVAGGAPMLKAFTDSARLQRFAVANGLAGPNGAVEILSIPVRGAVAYVEQFIGAGVHGIHFNADVESDGFFAPLAQLPTMKRYLDENYHPKIAATRESAPQPERPPPFERLDLGPVVAMRAQQLPYVRIDASGFVTPQQLAQLIVDPRLGQFLASSGKRAVLLNAAGMHRFGTEDMELIAERWAPLLAGIEIRRISLVVAQQVFDLFGLVFAHAATRAAISGVELRWFPSAQFTESFESVTWFDAPLGVPVTPVRSDGLIEMPRLLNPQAWERANVLGIAFLTPQGSPPGLGFIFQDAAAASSIFDGWRRDLGPRDENELLRVSIIEGQRPGKPPGYVVTMMPNVEALAAQAARAGGLSLDMRAFGVWAKSMNTPPEGSPHLAAWKQLYAQRGEYAIVPVLMTGGGPDPRYEQQLVKRQIHLRNVRDLVGPNDPDAFVMR